MLITIKQLSKVLTTLSESKNNAGVESLVSDILIKITKINGKQHNTNNNKNYNRIIVLLNDVVVN